MEQNKKRIAILKLEAETASEAAKGMSNLTWLRFNSFSKLVDRMKPKYSFGIDIYESECETWTKELMEVRHALEMMFQDFNRVEYLKNVAKTAKKSFEELESKEEKKGEEETKESRTRSDTDEINDDLNQF